MNPSRRTSVPVFASDRTPCAFSEAELAGVFELNTLFLEYLVSADHRAFPASLRAWAQPLEPQLSQLTPASRARLARCPVCLIDAGFQDEAHWQALAGSADLPYRPPVLGAPDAQALELAQMALTLAWTLARVNLEAACIVFAMTPKCADIVSGLGIHRLPSLAVRLAHDIRPAWADDPEIWQRLLSLAESAPPSRLPPLHVHAMLRQLAEVLLATPVSDPNQPSRP